MAGGLSRSHEERLIRLAAGGDRSAAEELIRAHQGGVLAYILRLTGHRQRAEDVVQEAFVRVLTNLDRFDPSYRFSTWLYTIARRVLLSTVQKEQVRQASDWTGELRSASEGPRDRAERQDSARASRDLVQRALMHLTPEQREIIVLFHQQGWTIAQVADHLEMPEGTIKSHLHRGRLRLREVIVMLEGASGIAEALAAAPDARRPETPAAERSGVDAAPMDVSRGVGGANRIVEGGR